MFRNTLNMGISRSVLREFSHAPLAPELGGGHACALNNAGLPVSAFLFLTSNYFSTTVSGNSTSPMQWGEIQGSLFATILGNYGGPFGQSARGRGNWSRCRLDP